MGNRAVIQFGKDKDAMGIYLHWNGGHESVKAFLDAARDLGIRNDYSYKVARIAQIIGNFFGGNCSVGVELARKLDADNHDNGVFIVEGFNIVERKFTPAEAIKPLNEEYYKGVYDAVMEANKELYKERVYK